MKAAETTSVANPAPIQEILLNEPDDGTVGEELRRALDEWDRVALMLPDPDELRPPARFLASTNP
jgi:hypothetical protein